MEPAKVQIFSPQAIVPGVDVDRWDSVDCGRNDKCDALPHIHHIVPYARLNTESDSLKYQRRFYTDQDEGDTAADNQRYGP